MLKIKRCIVCDAEFDKLGIDGHFCSISCGVCFIQSISYSKSHNKNFENVYAITTKAKPKERIIPPKVKKYMGRPYAGYKCPKCGNLMGVKRTLEHKLGYRLRYCKCIVCGHNKVFMQFYAHTRKDVYELCAQYAPYVPMKNKKNRSICYWRRTFLNMVRDIQASPERKQGIMLPWGIR